MNTSGLMQRERIKKIHKKLNKMEKTGKLEEFLIHKSLIDRPKSIKSSQ